MLPSIVSANILQDLSLVGKNKYPKFTANRIIAKGVVRMGSTIEINDTLEITVDQGFPSDIFDLSKHVVTPVTLKDLGDRIFNFHDKPHPHIFQLDPVRVFLLQNINDKWLFWGKVNIQSQTISKSFCSEGSWRWTTSGTYKVIEIYEPDYQKLFTIRESIPGLSYF